MTEKYSELKQVILGVLEQFASSSQEWQPDQSDIDAFENGKHDHVIELANEDPKYEALGRHLGSIYFKKHVGGEVLSSSSREEIQFIAEVARDCAIEAAWNKMFQEDFHIDRKASSQNQGKARLLFIDDGEKGRKCRDISSQIKFHSYATTDIRGADEASINMVVMNPHYFSADTFHRAKDEVDNTLEDLVSPFKFPDKAYDNNDRKCLQVKLLGSWGIAIQRILKEQAKEKNVMSSFTFSEDSDEMMAKVIIHDKRGVALINSYFGLNIGFPQQDKER